MKIVGCDLHARQQSIAMLDTETGDFTEKIISPRRQGRARVLRGIRRSDSGRHRSHGLDAMVFTTTRGVGNPASGGSSAQDSGGGDAEAETESTRCPLNSRPADDGGSVSGDLDAVDGARGFADFAARTSPVGQDASAIAAHHAVDGTQSGLATRSWPVECSGAGRAAGLASSPLHKSKTQRAAKFVRATAEANPRAG